VGARGWTGATGMGITGATGATGSTGATGANGTSFDFNTNPYPFLDIFPTIGTSTTIDNTTNGYIYANFGTFLSSIAISSSGQYQIACVYANGGGTQFSNNYGASFSNIGPVGIGNFSDIAMSASGQYITVVQNPGSIFVSSNYGTTWNQYFDPNFPTNNFYSSISISASGQYQSITGNYTNQNPFIATSSNYGVSWIIVGPVWGVPFFGGICIAISATGQFQTVISPGNIGFTSLNYGLSWNQFSIGVGNNNTRVAMSASGQYQTIVSSNNVALLFNSSNYGQTWTQNPNASTAWCNGISISASGQYQVVSLGQVNGGNYILQLSMDYGNTWTTTANGGQIFFYFPKSAISSSGQYISDCYTTSNFSSYNGVIVTREILMPAKTFVIDHPLDYSKYLIHACIEGPEAGVYYRGRGEITNNISTDIILPSYVEGIASNFTIEITHIYDGTTPKQYSVGELLYNHFTVYGENGEFFWQVTGTRANIVTEPDKNKITIKGMNKENSPYLWTE
jgi:photosystem II stability/assembly factor-like uncharacterized protein